MRLSSVAPSRDPILGSDVGLGNLGGLNEATFWQQLRATVIRNLLRKKRNLRQTSREIIPPLYFLALIVVMKLVIPSPTYPAVTRPEGTSSLIQTPLPLNKLTYINNIIGIVPRHPHVMDLMAKVLNSTLLKVNNFKRIKDLL
jgi:hypothetical protein